MLILSCLGSIKISKIERYSNQFTFFQKILKKGHDPQKMSSGHPSAPSTLEAKFSDELDESTKRYLTSKERHQHCQKTFDKF
jgi:hypothetical protein